MSQVSIHWITVALTGHHVICPVLLEGKVSAQCRGELIALTQQY